MSHGRNDVTDTVPPTTRSPESDRSFDEALVEVDAVISWSVEDGWSSADLARALGLEEADLDDWEEEPPVSTIPPYRTFEVPSTESGVVELDDDVTLPSAGAHRGVA